MSYVNGFNQIIMRKGASQYIDVACCKILHIEAYNFLVEDNIKLVLITMKYIIGSIFIKFRVGRR